MEQEHLVCIREKEEAVRKALIEEIKQVIITEQSYKEICIKLLEKLSQLEAKQ